ncbi:hypothetical protein MUB15_06050 [Priestia sp. OVS21]|nr:hypothetical protein [Priestia sp. OVS21]
MGAWLGADFGRKHTEKLNKVQADENAKSKFEIYTYDLNYNTDTFFRMQSCLEEILYASPSCFEPIEVSCKHIRRGSWEEFTKNDNYTVIELNLVRAGIAFEQALDFALRDIEISIANWKHVWEVSDKQGSVDIDSKFRAIKSHIQAMINTIIVAMEQFEEVEERIREKNYTV